MIMKNRRLACALLAAIAFAAPALARLDETCTVSILNRTAQVREDGSWVLGNVPSNMGMVRARATCIGADGMTRVGQSEYFLVPENGVVTVAQIEFEDVDAVPLSLTLTAPRVGLQQTGETVQLTAMAAFADGTTEDVTNRGTNFTSTNPAVMTVSPAGLVTARASGVVIVTALNEGTLALLRMGVGGVLDSDGDGMPDDYELANGLNPNSAADAALDADGDRLTNLDEYQRGTNPRVADTDGDGVGDGLEVETGSDPLDPRSVNLAQLLRSISASPSPLTIVVNTLLGESSRLITVTGTLADGSTVNLTSRGRGTTYDSTNIGVASFGSTDGQIFGGAAGTANVIIKNNGFTTTVPVTVTSFSPTAVSSLAMPGFANNVDVAGNFAYVAAGSAGLQIVDISNRANPRIIGSVPTQGASNDVRVAGQYAYVADAAGGVLIVDVSVPSQPFVAGVFDSTGTARDLVVNGSTLYLADGAAGLVILDVATPANPRLAGVANIGSTRAVTRLDSGVIVVAYESGGIASIDVTDPAAPVLLATLNAGSDIRDLHARGAIVAVAAFSNSLRLADFTQPRAPVLRGSTTTANGGILTDVETRGRFSFGADIFFVNGVPIVDISNPAGPLFRARLNFPLRDDNGTGIAVDTQYVYLTAERGATNKPGITGDTMLYIGRYISVDDNANVPPVSVITSPAANSAHVEGSTVTVSVEATDDVAVASVELLVDDVSAGVLEGPPYQFAAVLPAKKATATLLARARDYAGNVAPSQSVTVNLTPDTEPPLVLITSPPAGSTFGSGSTVTAAISATDNGNVAFVELLVGGTVVGSTSVKPYRIDFLVPRQSSATLTARATDLAGNTTVSAPVTISIFIDFPPAIEFFVPPTTPPYFTGARFHVHYRASDDRGVSQVELLMNGALKQIASRDPSFGFSPFIFEIPPGLAQVSLQIRATDNAGQQTTSAAWTFPVRQTSALGTTILPGFARALDVSGQYAFVAAGSSGLRVVDVSDPAHPTVVGGIDTPGDARDVRLAGNLAFVADGANGLVTIDVTQPLAPAIVSTLATDGEATRIAVGRDRLYVATPQGVNVVDVRLPSIPRREGVLRVEGGVSGIAADGTLVAILTPDIICANLNGQLLTCVMLSMVDASDPWAPRIVSSRREYATSTDGSDLVLKDARLYLGSTWGLYIRDVSVPSAPRELGFVGGVDLRSGVPPRITMALAAPRLVFPYVFAAETDGMYAAAPILDVANPNAPLLLGVVDFTAFNAKFGSGVAATPELIYLTNCHTQPCENQTQLSIGRYLTRTDAAGAAPTVRIAMPANDSSAFEGQTIFVTADASDDQAVKSVTFLVNGSAVFTDNVAPYMYSHVVPAGATQLLFTATALDYGGNTGTSASAVRVLVQRDVTAPQVKLLAPRAGETVPGQSVRLRADVTDDFRVARVEFLVNGSVVSTVNTPPWQADYAIPAGTANFTVAVRAEDMAGNANATAPVAISVVAPQLLGSLAMPGTVNGVAVNDRYAYVAAGTAGLKIVDLVNPAAPVIAGTLALTQAARQVVVIGTLAYVLQDARYDIVDVSVPAAPVILGGTDVSTDGLSLYFAVSANRLYTAVGGTVRQYDVSIASQPQHVQSVGAGQSGANAVGVAGDGDFVFAAFGRTITNTPGEGYLNSYEYSRLFNGFVQFSTFNQIGTFPSGFAMRDRIGAMTTRSDELITADYRAALPSTPAFLRRFTGVAGSAVAFSDSYLLLSGRNAPNRTLLYDLQDHQAPLSLGTFQFDASSTQTTLAATPELLLAVGNNNTLYVARYRTFNDTGTQAPAVTLLQPAAGFRPPVNRQLVLRASATDDVGVKSVAFTVNGITVCTDTVAPYECTYKVTSTASLQIAARATDYGGRTTTTPALTITP
jgi:hypothetical protein